MNLHNDSKSFRNITNRGLRIKSYFNDYMPINKILATTGNDIGASYFYHLFVGAEHGGNEGKFQLAGALWNTVMDEDQRKSLQPAFTEAAQDQTIKLAFRLFSEIGAKGFAPGAWMTAICYTYGAGCPLDIDEARRWQKIAESARGASKWKIIEELSKTIDAGEAAARSKGLWSPAPPTLPGASVPAPPTPGAARPKFRPQRAKKKGAQPVG